MSDYEKLLEIPKGIFNGSQVECVKNFVRGGKICNRANKVYLITNGVFVFSEGEDGLPFSISARGLFLQTELVFSLKLPFGILTKEEESEKRDRYLGIGITKDQFNEHFKIKSGSGPLNV